MYEQVLYLQQVLLHKWHVLRFCLHLGIFWRGITHDGSKLTPYEWKRRVRALRHYRQQPSRTEFDFAGISDELAECWAYHYRRNKHHWQHWVVPLDNGSFHILPMPETDRKEMLADWQAVALQANRLPMKEWYQLNRENLLLHADTRRWLEQQMGIQNTQ